MQSGIGGVQAEAKLGPKFPLLHTPKHLSWILPQCTRLVLPYSGAFFVTMRRGSWRKAIPSKSSLETPARNLRGSHDPNCFCSLSKKKKKNGTCFLSLPCQGTNLEIMRVCVSVCEHVHTWRGSLPVLTGFRGLHQVANKPKLGSLAKETRT